MLLKSKSRTAPRSDAARASRARVVRYVRRRSTFQRSSQSTFIEPGEASGDITRDPLMQSVDGGSCVGIRSSMLHSDEAGASEVRMGGGERGRATVCPARARLQYRLTRVHRLYT